MSRRLRLVLLASVALGLAPGTWLRTTPPPENTQEIIRFGALLPLPERVGELDVLGAWVLESPNHLFGGFSALVMLDDGRLMAGSDRGAWMTFTRPGAGRPVVRLGEIGDDSAWYSELYDLEALTLEAGTGRLWSAWESANAIMRSDIDFEDAEKVAPAAMAQWPYNSGPESMVRLEDGRFIVLAEGSGGWFEDSYPGLLFPDDPLEGAKPLEFRFRPPEGYRPVDIAQLPDGRVLVLVRKLAWGLPPTFPGKILVADPSDIAPGATWEGRVIGELDEPLPSDNYEGLAVTSQADGSVIIWVISDDNGGQLQRTLLLKLGWDPA